MGKMKIISCEILITLEVRRKEKNSTRYKIIDHKSYRYKNIGLLAKTEEDLYSFYYNIEKIARLTDYRLDYITDLLVIPKRFSSFSQAY